MLPMSRKRSRQSEPFVRSQTAVSSCKRCRSRKIKCDDGYPRCDGCEKADVLCIVVDPSTIREHSRAEVQSLEDELVQLQHALVTSVSHTEDGVNLTTFNEHIQDAQNTASATRLDNHSQQQPPLHQRCSEGFDKPHALPPYAYAVQAVTEYFREFHVCHPILDHEEVNMVLRDVYSDAGDSRMPEAPFNRAQKRDLFQLNMVLAIGSIKLFHECPGTLHPFGFFTAALEVSSPSEFHFNQASDVENLLLIAHFGLFYNIGCSIWELGRLCVRICIELQFHRLQNTPIPIATAAQRCGTVFWESYLLDRFSSSILGRPFAVEDEAISVDVPTSSVGKVFSHLLLIGRITSHMHNSMYHPTFQNKTLHTGFSFDKTSSLTGHTGPTNALLHLRVFHSRLQRWKIEAPVHESPTCVYETAEYFEMTFHEARLLLFRAVIHELPEGQLEIRRRLSWLCNQAAQKILVSFGKIKGYNLLSYKRSLARLILISGLMVVSTIKMRPLHASTRHEGQSHSDINVEFWLKDIALDSTTYLPDPVTCSTALKSCEQNLFYFASSIPEVLAYAQLFRKLRSEAETILGPHPAYEAEGGGLALSEGRPTAVIAPLETYERIQNEWQHGFIRPDATSQHPDLSVSAQFATNTILDTTILNQTLEADSARDFGFGIIDGDSLWTSPNEPWMEGIDGDISGMIWDTAMPWHWSPFTNP